MHLTAIVVATFASGFDGVADREPLHRAAYSGNIVQAHFAILRCPDAVNTPQRSGKGYYLSPVHLAAERHNVGVLKLLIARGGNVNDPGKAGATPLQLAMGYGRHVETAEVLLKHGATLDLYSAVALNKQAEVEGVLKAARAIGLNKSVANAKSRGPYSQNNCLLNWAVFGGHPEMIDLLVRYGAEVNPVPSPSSWWEISPLHRAAEDDRYEVVEALLKHGAKIEGKDYDGLTPLHRAVERGHVRVVKVLLKHGAKVDNREDFHGPRVSDINLKLSMNTVLHTAAGSCCPSAEIVALLLAYGADPNTTNADGRTPFDLAEQEGKNPPTHDHGEYTREWIDNNARVVKLLLRYGGKPGEVQK